MTTTNWFKELKEINENDEIIAIATEKGLFKSIDEAKAALDFEFDDGFGSCNGPSFTAWGKKRVYFPAGYDGSEWIENVPRNPSKEITRHIGG